MKANKGVDRKPIWKSRMEKPFIRQRLQLRVDAGIFVVAWQCLEQKNSKRRISKDWFISIAEICVVAMMNNSDNTPWDNIEPYCRVFLTGGCAIRWFDCNYHIRSRIRVNRKLILANVRVTPKERTNQRLSFWVMEPSFCLDGRVQTISVSLSPSPSACDQHTKAGTDGRTDTLSG